MTNGVETFGNISKLARNVGLSIGAIAGRTPEARSTNLGLLSTILDREEARGIRSSEREQARRQTLLVESLKAETGVVDSILEAVMSGRATGQTGFDLLKDKPTTTAFLDNQAGKIATISQELGVQRNKADIMQALEAQLAVPKAPALPNLQNFRTPTGETVVLDENDPATQQQVQAGGLTRAGTGQTLETKIADIERLTGRQLTQDQILQLQGIDQQFGFSLEFDNDGNLSGIRMGGGAGQAPKGLSAGDRDELLANQDTLRLASGITGQLLQQLETNPEIFGVTGTARGFGQRFTGIVEDVARTGLTFLGLDAQSGFDLMTRVIEQQDLEPDVARALAPSQPGELEVYQALLKFQVARSLQPTDRLLKDTIDTAARITDLTGLKSSQEVRDKLAAIQGHLSNRQATLQRRIEFGTTGQITTPLPETTQPAPTTAPERVGAATSQTRTDFEAMSIDDLANIDIGRLSPKEQQIMLEVFRSKRGER